MKRLAGGPLYLLLGATLGVFSAAAAIDSVGSTAAGPGNIWQYASLSEDSSAKPYLLARFLTQGRLPPSAGQLQEFVAAKDSDGQRFSAGCVYALIFDPAPEVWWSATTLSGGTPMAGPGRIVSAEFAVVEADGKLRITASSKPQPGNWLRSPAAGGYAIQLTLALGAAPGEGGTAADLPRIERSGC